MEVRLIRRFTMYCQGDCSYEREKKPYSREREESRAIISYGVPRDVSERELICRVRGRQEEVTDIGRRKNILGRREKGKAPALEDARVSGKVKENHVTGSTGKPGEGADMDTEVLTDESLSPDFIAGKWLKGLRMLFSTSHLSKP